MSEPKYLCDWHDELDFGRHRGKTVLDVYHQDCTYLRWLITNTDKSLFDVNKIDIILAQCKKVDEGEPNIKPLTRCYYGQKTRISQ